MANLEEKNIPLWRSLRLKYAIANLIVLLVTVVLLNTYPLFVSQDLVFQAKHTSLQSQAAVIASPLAGLKNLTTEGVEQVMTQLGPTGATRVVVTDPYSFTLYDTDTTGEVLVLEQLDVTLSGNNVFRSQYRDHTFFSYAAAPVTYRETVIGTVYVYETDPQQGHLIASIQNNFRTISIIISIITLIISSVFSSALMRRMDSLLRAIRTVRDGSYSHRIPLTGGDEITRLTENFNELADRLETTERVRRQFVSDASHELKTPLASIRLLSDSIIQSQDMDTATALEFVTDIGSEADRLTRITEKLLTLTKVDSAVELVSESVSLTGIAEKVRSTLAPLAAQSGIQITVEGCAQAVVTANEDDMHQILFNLMENAVKYNMPHGHVWVVLAREGNEATVAVSDTGVGIPQDDMSKIFDRFFRVDKARSRAAGGTGLGLSIVRDLAQQHGGTVTVAARPGGGSVFVLRLPASEPNPEGEISKN